MQKSKTHLAATTLAFSLALVTLQFFSPHLLHSLSFWPEKLISYEYWRLVTGHLIHFNFIHCIINIISLWIIIFIFYSNASLKITSLFLLFCCLGVDTGLYFFGATNQEYIGLSGALHGLAIAGAVYCRQYTFLRRWIFIGIVFAKVIYENMFDVNASGIAIHYQFIVATDAHAYGAISGLLIAAITQLVDVKRQKSAPPKTLSDESI